jgi:hypothetical protein
MMSKIRGEVVASCQGMGINECRVLMGEHPAGKLALYTRHNGLIPESKTGSFVWLEQQQIWSFNFCLPRHQYKGKRLTDSQSM